MNVTFFLCLVFISCIDSSQGALEIFNFFTNETEEPLDLGTPVEFRCIASLSSTFYNVRMRSPDGRFQLFTAAHFGNKTGLEVNVFYEEKQMTCVDGGTYTCFAYLPDERDPPKRDTIINVKCPITYTNGDLKRFKLTPDDPVFRIPFVGYPDPSDVQMFKIDKSVQEPVSIEFNIIRRQSRALGFINITMNVADENPDVVGDYVLLASNSLQEDNPARLEFSIYAPEPDDSDSDQTDVDEIITRAAGGAAAVIIIAVIGIVFFYRKIKPNMSRQPSSTSNDQTTTAVVFVVS